MNSGMEENSAVGGNCSGSSVSEVLLIRNMPRHTARANCSIRECMSSSANATS